MDVGMKCLYEALTGVYTGTRFLVLQPPRVCYEREIVDKQLKAIASHVEINANKSY